MKWTSIVLTPRVPQISSATHPAAQIHISGRNYNSRTTGPCLHGTPGYLPWHCIPHSWVKPPHVSTPSSEQSGGLDGEPCRNCSCMPCRAFFCGLMAPYRTHQPQLLCCWINSAKGKNRIGPFFHRPILPAGHPIPPTSHMPAKPRLDILAAKWTCIPGPRCLAGARFPSSWLDKSNITMCSSDSAPQEASHSVERTCWAGVLRRREPVITRISAPPWLATTCNGSGRRHPLNQTSDEGNQNCLYKQYGGKRHAIAYAIWRIAEKTKLALWKLVLYNTGAQPRISNLAYLTP